MFCHVVFSLQACPVYFFVFKLSFLFIICVFQITHPDPSPPRPLVPILSRPLAFSLCLFLPNEDKISQVSALERTSINPPVPAPYVTSRTVRNKFFLFCYRHTN